MMMKEMIKSWAFMAVYGYGIGPAIDDIIGEPNPDNEILGCVKGLNQVFTIGCKLGFIAPIWATEFVVSEIKDKVKA